MATLSGRDRGQLLLAGAFVLAVAMIGLTLVFSAGSYTSSLADEEGTVSQSSSALTARESVRASFASALEIVNSKPISNANRKGDLITSRAFIADGTEDHYARRGRLVTVSGVPSFTDGTRITQSQTTAGNYLSMDEPSTGDTDWSLAQDVSARNVSFELDGVPASSGTFKIIFQTPGSEEWVIDVSQPGGGSNPWQFVVEERMPGSSFSGTCTYNPASGTPVMLDVSEATIAGDHCSALEAIQPTSDSYTIRIEGGSNARGRYWISVDEPSSSSDINSNFGSLGSETDTEDVLYAATVTYEYHSASVTYRTPLRIAPGEIE